MPSIRANDLLALSDRSVATDPLARLLTQGVARQQSAANNAVPTQSADAVQQTTATDSIDPASQSLAQLQTLIEQLNQSTSATDVNAVLTAIADFAQSKSASFLGDTVDKLATLAGDILSQIPQNATGASFSFNAGISQQAISSQDYYKNATSISFSFSYQDATTQFQAAGNFADSLEQKGSSVQYQSYEQVTLSVTTSNIDLASNPALKAFSDLTQSFNNQVQSLFGNAANDNAQAVSNGGYRKASVLERLQLQFENLVTSSNQNQSLLDALKALFEKPSDSSALQAQAA